MKRTLLNILVVCALVAATTVWADHHEETKTLTGEYHWTQNDTVDKLEAKFVPTGDNTWDVSFHFKFREQPHVYSGSATGDMSEGSELSGRVMNEGKKRTFEFQGTFDENGAFSGTHSEKTKGRERDTGVLTLK